MDKSCLKIHLAGYHSGRAGMFKLENYKYLLESYHYINSDRMTRLVRQTGIPVFLDSGAFSAFTQKIEIDLPTYCQFIKNNADIIEVASVLDGIGDPELTLTNQKRMEDLGTTPLPCFHYGEDPKFLEHYIENYDHITLGGMVPISNGPLQKWLDHIWANYLTDENGYPRLRVHGFGLTSLPLMLRYPWYSVDSTSWVLTGSFGSIYWPTKKNPEGKLAISDQSPRTKDLGQHYDTLSDIERARVDEIIESRGFTAEELRTVYWKRDVWNIDFFRQLCDRPMFPFIKKEQGLFDA